MLFDIATLVLLFCFPAAVFAAYRKGLIDGLNIKKDKPIETTRHSTANVQQKDDDRFTKLMDNINAYDGTGRGQTDV